MKNKSSELRWLTLSKTRQCSMRTLLLFLIALFAYTDGMGQTWTARYGNGQSLNFFKLDDQRNEYILQAFDYGNGCNAGLLDGRVIHFRNVDISPVFPGDFGLQVALVDRFGQEINLGGSAPDIIPAPNGMQLIPKAAAYNPNTQEYIVCGYAETNPGTMGIWFIIFDRDLQPIALPSGPTDYIRIKEDAGGQNLYVTDVCATTANGAFDYAFVGKREAIFEPDLWTAIANQAPTLFVMEIESSSPTTNFFDVSWAGATRLVPNKIIELPVPAPNSVNGGYFISGTDWAGFPITPIPWNTPTNVAANTELAYFRCRYNATNVATDFSGIKYSSGGPDAKLNAQALLYDPSGNGTIFVSGNGLADVGGFVEGIVFFDRIDDVNITIPSNISNLTDSYNLGTPGLPFVVNQSADYFMRFAYVEGVYDNLQITGSATAKHIVGRLLEDVSANTGNLPYVMEIDYNNLNWTTWPLSTGGMKFGTLYNRLAPTSSHPGFHSQAENTYFLSGINYHQIEKNINASNSNEDYYFGTYVGESAIAASRADLGFGNDCSTLAGLWRPTQFALALGSAPTAINTLTANNNQQSANPYAEFSATSQCDPIINPFIYVPPVSELQIWAAEGQVIWNGDLTNIYSLEMLDIAGNKIKEVSGNDLFQFRFSMADFANGIYLIKANYIDTKRNPEIIKVYNN